MKRRSGLAACVTTSLAVLLAGSGSHATPIATSGDYALALDAETNGKFSALVRAGDPALALEAYPELVAAYSRLLDQLHEAYSPHANQLPGWWSTRLLSMGLGRLSSGTQVEFFQQELADEDFDRVIHAYYILASNELDLVSGSGAGALTQRPTPLWESLLQAARNDPDGRYWIALRLAEARMLSRTGRYDSHHTRMASRHASVYEKLGENAKLLGPRIYRVLGLSPNAHEDPHVAHLLISEAKAAAADRIRRHELEQLGRSAAYAALMAELTALGQDFQSRRFNEMMRKDLLFVTKDFGPPDNTSEWVEQLQALCRGKGANRMRLWNAADRLEELWVRAQVPETPRVLPTSDEIVAMNADAEAFVSDALLDPTDPELALHIFDTNAVPALVENGLVADPRALRAGVRQGFYQLGYPQNSRASYLAALAALGPPPASTLRDADKLARLTKSFEQASSVEQYGASFDLLRTAAGNGGVPLATDETLIASLIDAAVRVVTPEEETMRAATLRRVDAQQVLRKSVAEIEHAEQEVLEANAAIRAANETLAAAEARQSTAVADQNDAIGRLNAAVTEVESTRRTARSSAATPAQRAAAEAAMQRLRELERTIEPQIDALAKDARREEQAADAAAQTANEQLARATRFEEAAREAAARENEAAQALEAAAAAESRTRLKVAEVLGGLVVGLDFLGVRAPIQDRGERSGGAGDRNARLAALAMLLERAHGGESISNLRATLEREAASDDEQLSGLGRLVIAVEANRRKGRAAGQP